MQNKRKSDRSQGKAYVTKSGKVIKERLPKPANCSCHHKCPEHFSEEDRKKINADYWSLADYCKQRLFLSNNIKVEKCKRTLTRESRRSNTLKYFLNDKQVCKNLFLNTLHVSDCAISVLAKKKKREFVDMRGKHGMQRKVDAEIATLIKEHIESFPAVESHYTRAKSQRLYLSSDLTITKMYNLFKERHPDLSVKEHMYRHIFCNNYNYSFHHPKKDTCLTCETFKNTEDKASIQKSYDEHLANKAQARLHKHADKELSKNNSNIKVFTFDLQSVLSTPCSNVSTLYYSRKFATYNNTFYDLANGAGYCFLWDENHGKRGSEEIGTTLLKMLNNLPESVTDVILYSDCCGGQNRNRLIGTLLLHINHSLHFNSITMKYLQSGHTQMEADSMHSAIERTKRNICVYSPEEWPTILRLARRKNPYAVERLNYIDIIDLKTAFSKLNHNLKKNVNNESVNWLKIKVLQVIKSEKRQLLYKEQWNEDFKVIDIDGSRMKKKGVTNFTLTHKYKKELPISDTKLKDLKDLCKKNVIPPGSQTFFLNLQGGNNRDCLDEPDRFEEEDADDNN